MDTQTLKTTHLGEQDFCLWLEQTVNLLKEGNLAELDIENLIAENENS